MSTEEKKRISGKSLRRAFRLFAHAAPWKGSFMLGLGCLMVSSLSALLLFSRLGKLIDAQIGSDSQQTLTILGWIGLILLIQATASFLIIYTFAIVSENTVARIRNEVFGRLIRLPMSFYAQHRVGELNSRITADIASIRDTMTTYLAELIRQLVVIFGSLVILLMTSVKLTLFMTATLPVMVLAAVIFGRKVRRLSRQAMQEVADTSTIAEETFQAIASVKAFVRETYEWNRYKKANESVVSTGIRNAVWRGGLAAFIIVFVMGAVASIVWFGSGMVGNGEISAGDLFQFFLLSGFMTGSVGGLAETYGQIQKAVGATEHLLDLLEEKPEEISITPNVSPRFKGKIEIRNLHFSYPDKASRPAISDLNLSISAGEKLALAGPSGAGKSTLAHLLLRFYQPSEGQLFLDDRPADEIPLQDWRQAFALVPQDIILFGGTIAENIRYGRLNASEEEVKEAARLAYAHEFICSFPDSYNTRVGERGTRLSGGQRQRIAIARAILADPAVLILDEATSALDPASEKEVHEALQQLMKGRTSIIIAHRLSTIRDADRILVLDQGQIVEQGSHEELMQSGGWYVSMVKLSAHKNQEIIHYV